MTPMFAGDGDEQVANLGRVGNVHDLEAIHRRFQGGGSGQFP